MYTLQTLHAFQIIFRKITSSIFDFFLYYLPVFFYERKYKWQVGCVFYTMKDEWTYEC